MIATGKGLGAGRPANAGTAEDGAANPENPQSVAAKLVAYLRHRWRLSRLAFLAPPEVIPHGWETYTYRFQMQNCSGLPEAFSRPLILRIYASPVGLPSARREWL